MAPLQTEPPETLEPTEIPPTPEPPTPGPPPEDQNCAAGLPSPQLFWTVYATPPDRAWVWVPYQRNGGPFVQAWVKAKYGNEWYTAFIDQSGELRPSGQPVWPRSDIIRLAGAGAYSSRQGNPMCGANGLAALPPCYKEMIYPLVFLNKLASGGPYLRRAYFWVSTVQVAADEHGYPSRVTFGSQCDPSRIGTRGLGSRPIYAAFDGCSGNALRIDTCYSVGGG